MEHNDSDTFDAGVAGEEEIRLYEAAFHLSPNLSDEEALLAFSRIRDKVEAESGKVTGESLPARMSLAYPISIKNNNKNTHFDQSYFGWITFTTVPSVAHALASDLKGDKDVLRSLVIRVQKESARNHKRAVQHGKAVKQLKTPRKDTEEKEGVVSQSELDKSIEELVTTQ